MSPKKDGNSGVKSIDLSHPILYLKISIQDHKIFSCSDDVDDFKIDIFSSNVKWARQAPLYTTPIIHYLQSYLNN